MGPCCRAIALMPQKNINQSSQSPTTHATLVKDHLWPCRMGFVVMPHGLGHRNVTIPIDSQELELFSEQLPSASPEEAITPLPLCPPGGVEHQS